jgi:hypothetical protein
MKVPRSVLFLAKGCVSAGLVAWLISKVGLASVWQQAQGLRPDMAAVAILLMLVQIFLGALRWGVLLRALAGPVSGRQTLSVYWISNFFAQVLPGAVGGDAVRMWFTRKAGLPLSAAIDSVLLERGITVLALVCLVVATQPFLLARVPGIPGSWIFPALLALGFLSVAALCVLDRLPERFRHLRVVRGLAQLAVDSRRVFFAPRFGLFALVVALIGNINLALSAYFLARGLGLDVAAVDCMVLIPPIILIMTLPISIAGWGLREGAMVTAFGFLGIAPGPALTLSVLYGFVSLLAALPGGAVFLFSEGRRAAAEAALAKEAMDEIPCP